MGIENTDITLIYKVYSVISPDLCPQLYYDFGNHKYWILLKSFYIRLILKTNVHRKVKSKNIKLTSKFN